MLEDCSGVEKEDDIVAAKVALLRSVRTVELRDASGNAETVALEVEPRQRRQLHKRFR